MSVEITQDQWVERFDQLAEKDYVMIDGFLDEATVRSLREQIIAEEEEDRLKTAGIGANDGFQVVRAIRNDKIRWLKRDEENPSAGLFFEKMEEVKALLNRFCFLSLSDFEFHFAHYPQGSFYKRHLDQFKENDNRLITAILYLNDGWHEEDGGLLRIYAEEGPKDIYPLGGRLLLFRSDKLEHEVLPTERDRYSITGWLLHKPAGLGFL